MFEYYVVVMDSSGTVHKICEVAGFTGIIDADIEEWAKSFWINYAYTIWACYKYESEQIKFKFVDGKWRMVV